MVGLYLTSLEPAAGKSAMCTGIGKRLLKDGKKVGFLKPVLVSAEPQSGEVVDQDAAFIKQVLALEEPVASLCVAALTPQTLEEALASRENGLGQKLRAAYEEVSRDRDVVVLEGISGQAQASAQIAKLLGAKAIIVTLYAGDSTTGEIAAAAQTLGDSLLGVIINAVPQNKIESVRTSMVPRLEESEVRVLGVLPQDRALFTLSVGEIAQRLQGKLLNSAEGSGELVENLMMGTMYVGSGIDYFDHKANKAVIIRGERPDMQLAALETSTKCLILSGNTPPTPSILNRAQEKGVPIVVAEPDTLSTAAIIEDALGKARFRQEKKVERLEEILAQHFDFQALYKELGLAG